MPKSNEQIKPTLYPFLTDSEAWYLGDKQKEDKDLSYPCSFQGKYSAFYITGDKRNKDMKKWLLLVAILLNIILATHFLVLPTIIGR